MSPLPVSEDAAVCKKSVVRGNNFFHDGVRFLDQRVLVLLGEIRGRKRVLRQRELHRLVLQETKARVLSLSLSAEGFIATRGLSNPSLVSQPLAFTLVARG